MEYLQKARFLAYKTKDIDCMEKSMKNIGIRNTYKMRRGTLK